jgi:hypothetical protein
MSVMPGLDAVTDADREWFAAHPHRRYRLRPTAVAELLPGEAMGHGERMVVAFCSPSARLRLRVGRPPPRLRQDTDRTCLALIKAVDEAGCTLGGKTVRAALWEIRRTIGGIARSAEPCASAGPGRQSRPV